MCRRRGPSLMAVVSVAANAVIYRRMPVSTVFVANTEPRGKIRGPRRLWRRRGPMPVWQTAALFNICPVSGRTSSRALPQSFCDVASLLHRRIPCHRTLLATGALLLIDGASWITVMLHNFFTQAVQKISVWPFHALISVYIMGWFFGSQ